MAIEPPEIVFDEKTFSDIITAGLVELDLLPASWQVPGARLSFAVAPGNGEKDAELVVRVFENG